MGFSELFRQQLYSHGSIQSQDVVKLCYQVAFGAEHLLNDVEAAKGYFDREFRETEAADIPIYEPISDEFCRVNIAAWKYNGLAPKFLFNMFVASVAPVTNGNDLFLKMLEEAAEVISQGGIHISLAKHKLFIQEYLSNGIRPVHHSQEYREAEKPAYRILNRKYMKILPILAKVEAKGAGAYVISIDGPAASGKSTLSEMLAMALDCDVVHMDDFFLPPELRTSSRLAEPGGNVHYERFIDQVLQNIQDEKEFCYGAFDCSRMAMGETVVVRPGKYRVVEGSYSHHPLFGNYADLKVFLEIDRESQRRRIMDRNGPRMWERFHRDWIPMEEKYFNTFGIPGKADVKIVLP